MDSALGRTPPLRTMALLLVLGSASAFTLGTGATSLAATRTSPRRAALGMNTWPPPLDSVHVFNLQYGGAKTTLALTQMPNGQSAALLPLWRLQLASQADDGQPDSSAVASLGPTTTTFGVYLNGVESPVNALALVRFESDADDNKIMIIDAVVVEPSAPQKVRAPLQTAVVGALCAIGLPAGFARCPEA